MILKPCSLCPYSSEKYLPDELLHAYDPNIKPEAADDFDFMDETDYVMYTDCDDSAATSSTACNNSYVGGDFNYFDYQNTVERRSTTTTTPPPRVAIRPPPEEEEKPPPKEDETGPPGDLPEKDVVLVSEKLIDICCR